MGASFGSFCRFGGGPFDAGLRDGGGSGEAEAEASGLSQGLSRLVIFIALNVRTGVD